MHRCSLPRNECMACSIFTSFIHFDSFINEVHYLLLLVPVWSLISSVNIIRLIKMHVKLREGE